MRQALAGRRPAHGVVTGRDLPRARAMAFFGKTADDPILEAWSMRVRLPWLDRRGRFSTLKATTLALLMAPGLVAATRYLANDLGARPLNEAIHATGLWAVRLLLLPLLVTPAGVAA